MATNNPPTARTEPIKAELRLMLAVVVTLSQQYKAENHQLHSYL